MSAKKTKPEPYSEAGLKSRWREHELAHPFGLLTPIKEGPEATAEAIEKLARIIEYVDPDMSAEAQQRLWEVLRICQGFQIHGKPGRRQPEKKWEVMKADRFKLATIAMYLHNYQKTDSEDKAAELVGFDRRTFNRMKKRQPELWQALSADQKFCQTILDVGNSDPTEEHLEQARQWAEEHPAKIE